MALDAALLSAAERDGACTLRLYAWDPPTLSFGRNEPALRRYDRAAIGARSLAVVRRPTGGREEYRVTCGRRLYGWLAGAAAGAGLAASACGLWRLA